MPDEVQITNVALGIRIPVVVENKPNEPVPVNLPSDATLQLRPPAFLVVGKRYNFLHTEVGLVNPITLLSVDGYPWVRIQSNDPNKPPFFINLELLGSIEEI
jgi:hypothetical protein